jgi:hypothetical protein
LQIIQPPYYKAISLLEEIPTTGNSPLKIIAENIKMYAAKNSKNKFPATDIINELIAHYLLLCWKIYTPNIAIIEINANDIKEKYSNNHKPNYYNIPVFGSEWIQNAIELSEFDAVNSLKDFNRYHDPFQIFMIALFDIWVVNDDRKHSNTNILLTTKEDKLQITPIDHSFIFASMNYQNLDPNDEYFTYNDHILESNFA